MGFLLRCAGVGVGVVAGGFICRLWVRLMETLVRAWQMAVDHRSPTAQQGLRFTLSGGRGATIGIRVHLRSRRSPGTVALVTDDPLTRHHAT